MFRLFFGGFCRIRIESIRIRNTKQIWQNYETIIYSLFYFDCLITGATLYDSGYKISDDDVITISNLLNNILGKPTTEIAIQYE